jgi:hypothetical protein
MILLLGFLFLSYFQTTWFVNGYQFKLPDALAMAVQSGDYAGHCEMFLDGKQTAEFKFYVGIIKI